MLVMKVVIVVMKVVMEVNVMITTFITTTMTAFINKTTKIKKNKPKIGSLGADGIRPDSIEILQDCIRPHRVHFIGC